MCISENKRKPLEAIKIKNMAILGRNNFEEDVHLPLGCTVGSSRKEIGCRCGAETSCDCGPWDRYYTTTCFILLDGRPVGTVEWEETGSVVSEVVCTLTIW
jgi:hypothetical protein